jgi:hypothetical protein
MTISPAHRLVVGYAVLLVLLNFAVLLPGNLTSTFWGTVGRVVIQALIVWRLWYRSQVAWVIAVGLALLTVVAMFLMAAPMNPAIAWLTALSLAQAAVLCTRPVLAFVWSRQTSSV